MRTDLASLIPKDKGDTSHAEAIVALGYPEIAPIIPTLIEWMQDMNWPVARVLQPFLASIGAPLEPHIRKVLETNDDVWKYWVIRFIVAESTELMQIFNPELKRLASSPTKDEREEDLDLLAREILAKADSQRV